MTDEISRSIAALVLTVRICFKHLPKKGITWGFLSPEQTHSIIFLARRGETVVFLFGFIWFATVADALMGRVRTDVPQSLSSTVPLFTSPYVSQSRCSPTLYSPVPMFPSPFLPRRGTPYVSQSLCFPVHLLPSPYVPQRCSPIPMFPNSFWYDLINVTQQHGGFILRLIKATLPEVTHNCLKAHRDGYYQHISLLKLNFPLQIKVSSHLPSKSTLQYTWEKFT